MKLRINPESIIANITLKLKSLGIARELKKKKVSESQEIVELDLTTEMR